MELCESDRGCFEMYVDMVDDVMGEELDGQSNVYC